MNEYFSLNSLGTTAFIKDPDLDDPALGEKLTVRFTDIPLTGRIIYLQKTDLTFYPQDYKAGEDVDFTNKTYYYIPKVGHVTTEDKRDVIKFEVRDRAGERAQSEMSLAIKDIPTPEILSHSYIEEEDRMKVEVKTRDGYLTADIPPAMSEEDAKSLFKIQILLLDIRKGRRWTSDDDYCSVGYDCDDFAQVAHYVLDKHGYEASAMGLYTGNFNSNFTFVPKTGHGMVVINLKGGKVLMEPQNGGYYYAHNESSGSGMEPYANLAQQYLAAKAPEDEGGYFRVSTGYSNNDEVKFGTPGFLHSLEHRGGFWLETKTGIAEMMSRDPAVMFSSTPSAPSNLLKNDQYQPSGLHNKRSDVIAIEYQIAGARDLYYGPLAEASTERVYGGHDYSSSVKATINHRWNDSGMTYKLVEPPSAGSLKFESNGSYVYTPAESFTGKLTFRYQAFYYGRPSNIATVTITVLPPLPPKAEDDRVSSSNHEPVTIYFLRNDTSPQAHPLRLQRHTQPAHGIVFSNILEGTFTYTPNEGFNGTDSFEYTIKDSYGATATARVMITVNRPPEVVDGSMISVDQNGSVIFNLSHLATDLDGNKMSFILNQQPMHGLIQPTGNPDEYRYTPNTNYAGNDDVIDFTVSDFDDQGEVLSSVSAQIYVEVKPDPSLNNLLMQLQEQLKQIEEELSKMKKTRDLSLGEQNKLLEEAKVIRDQSIQELRKKQEEARAEKQKAINEANAKIQNLNNAWQARNQQLNREIQELKRKVQASPKNSAVRRELQARLDAAIVLQKTESAKLKTQQTEERKKIQLAQAKYQSFSQEISKKINLANRQFSLIQNRVATQKQKIIEQYVKIAKPLYEEAQVLRTKIEELKKQI